MVGTLATQQQNSVTGLWECPLIMKVELGLEMIRNIDLWVEQIIFPVTKMISLVVQIDKMGYTSLILGKFGWDVEKATNSAEDILKKKWKRSHYWIAVRKAIHLRIKGLQQRSKMAFKKLYNSKCYITSINT